MGQMTQLCMCVCVCVRVRVCVCACVWVWIHTSNGYLGATEDSLPCNFENMIISRIVSHEKWSSNSEHNYLAAIVIIRSYYNTDYTRGFSVYMQSILKATELLCLYTMGGPNTTNPVVHKHFLCWYVHVMNENFPQCL